MVRISPDQSCTRHGMVTAMVDSIFSVLARCALLHSVCDLKGTQMNMQRELMLYEFTLDHNVAEATKNIFCAKGEDAVVYNTVNRCFMKFGLGCKNLDEEASWGRPKTVDSEAVLQTIEANSDCVRWAWHFIVQCCWSSSRPGQLLTNYFLPDFQSIFVVK